MRNYDLMPNEVILTEGTVTSKQYKGNLLLTLTSEKIVLERERGLFKKERELIDLILLNNIKFYDDAAQVKQKGNSVDIQTIEENLTLVFSGFLDARKFTTRLIDAATGTTLAKRGADKIKGAINMVDDTLGLDTRGTIKGLLENGVKGTIINGIGKKN